jgi:hypothetical protein
MFGHDQDDSDKPNDENQHTDQPADDVITPSATDTTDDNWQHPGPPPDDADDSQPAADTSPETNSAPSVDTTPPPAPVDNPAPQADNDGASNDLIDLKREALTKLSPLVDHLDQPPDEKFRTLMMMIQASDDQSLIKQAYEAAQKIDDEKDRAQALLDIVNEINYFTQNPPKPE